MSNLRAIPFSKASTNSVDTLNSSSSLTSLSSSSMSSSILTPPEEPFIAKKSILINNPNIINGINISNNNISSPLTPPDYTSFEKRSVSFNIPEDNKNFHNSKFVQPSYIQDDDDDFEMNIEDDDDFDENDVDDADTLAEYVSSIDISANDEINVALLERDTEMRELFIINKDYFDGVKQFISDHNNNGATCNTWQEFLNLLFSKREEISDKKWMKCIGDHLKENPLFLVKFKEIVGYFGDDDDDDVIDDDAVVNNDNNINDQFYKDNYYYQNNNFIDVTLIRDFPKILENFESSYPQFFINLKQTLGTNCSSNSNNYFNSDEEESTPYEQFKNILLKSRNEITDVEWEETIYSILNPCPRLIEQFEEIIAYEVADE